MRLQNYDQAIIPESKLRGYLLSRTHPIGRFKAQFFSRLGYSSENWQLLEDHIRRLLREDAEKADDTVHGTKYLVRGTISGPSARANIVTVWMVLKDEEYPRLITAYPEE